MSEAMAEAILIAKKARERAEKAEAQLADAHTGIVKATANAALAAERLKDEEGKHAQTQKKLKKARDDNRTLRAKIRDLQNEAKLPQDAVPIEVISFIDSSGHSVIINCTGTAQKLKVLREIVKAAIHHDHIDPHDKEHYDVTAILESGTPEELEALIHAADLPQSGTSREGFSPVRANDGWPIERDFED